jgi:ribonuclease VapC
MPTFTTRTAAGVIVVDSSALVAVLRREPEADAFLEIIAAADRCLLSAVSLVETGMALAGRSGDASSWIELDALIA